MRNEYAGIHSFYKCWLSLTTEPFYGGFLFAKSQHRPFYYHSPTKLQLSSIRICSSLHWHLIAAEGQLHQPTHRFRLITLFHNPPEHGEPPKFLSFFHCSALTNTRLFILLQESPKEMTNMHDQATSTTMDKALLLPCFC